MYLHKAQVFLVQNQLILLVNNEYDQQNKGLYVSVTVLQCISLIICTQLIICTVCVNEEISQFLPGVYYYGCGLSLCLKVILDGMNDGIVERVVVVVYLTQTQYYVEVSIACKTLDPPRVRGLG